MNLITRLKKILYPARREDEAKSAYASGRLDDAIAYAYTLYEFDLSNPWANFLLGCHHLEGERYGQALEHLDRVTREWPEDASAWYAVGVCEDHLNHLPSAISAYNRALAISPEWHKAKKNIGRDFYLLGDFRQAEDALQSYFETSSEDQEALDLLGYVCYRQGKYMASYRHYEHARRLDPMNAKLDRNARLLYGRSATS